jgi:hypothetical protein
MRGERAIFFLSGLAGWRCLHLFSGLYGTTEVVPFQELCESEFFRND